MTVPAAVGVDLGGTKLLAVVMVGDEVAASVSRPTGRTIGVEGVARLLDEVLDALAASSGLSMDDCQLAVGFPGLVDGASGRVRRSVILDGWDGVDVAAALSDDTRRVVGVANDVHRAAAGEVWFRRRRGETVGDLMCITVGTGIGGAIVIDGQVWPGGSGVAGEIGHVHAGGDERCDCGARGCAHLVASGRAIEGRLGVTPGSLGALLAGGDPVARREALVAADRLGAVLASAMHLLDLPLVAIGGGLGSWPEFVPAVAASFERSAMPQVSATCRVEPLAAGPVAGAIGAALAAREGVTSV